MFRVGQKVVRFKEFPPGSYADDCGAPDIGQVCIVRSVIMCPVQKKEGIRLEGWRLPFIKEHGEEAAYHADCFRPAVERKTETGMAILREILDRESHQDRVPERAQR